MIENHISLATCINRMLLDVTKFHVRITLSVIF